MAKSFPNHFIPISQEECKALGYAQCDIIFVTGDTYIDSPFIGVSLLARFLESKGYKVAILPQPDINSLDDIKRFGQPRLFWAVTAGSIDSMLANYTALLKRRKSDDLTPGGINNKRPDRATIVYVNLIRRAYKDTAPIIIGGIEASTRRITHYDYWDNKIRKSILFDSKADILIYGMAEKTILEIAKIAQQILDKDKDETIENANEIIKKELKKELINIKGICFIDKNKPENSLEIPSFEQVSQDKDLFAQSQLKFFEYIYSKIDSPLIQKHLDRYLIHNPPQSPLTRSELDEIYELPFNHDAHPLLKKMGKIVALDTIPFSVTTHRGCFGGCNFCSIAIHQGKTLVSRSKESIIKEIKNFEKLPNFNGIIRDVGGPTANMYEVKCKKYSFAGSCIRQSCLFPKPCEFLEVSHIKYLKLLEEIKKISFIKKVFVASGIRYDLILLDKEYGEDFLYKFAKEFTSGQFKIAPEHIEDDILKLMGKPPNKILAKFLSLYSRIIEKIQKFNENNKKVEIPNKFISFYLITAYPGCKIQDMAKMKNELDKYYFIDESQVQIFTPLPLTYAALQYYLEKEPKTGQKLFIEKDLKKKKEQKDIMFL